MRTMKIGLLAGICLIAAAQDKTAIEKKLVSEYTLTQPTADNTDIVTAGSILVLLKGNVMMVPVSGSNMYQNTYKEGKISQNIFGKLAHIPGTPVPSGPTLRTFVPGEKMWVTKIECKDDGVMFNLFTDAYADVRYKASLKFAFQKGAHPSVDQVDKLVAEVFKVQPSDTGGGDQQQQQAAPAPQRQQQAAPPPAPEAVPAPIPPPPPPPAEEAPPAPTKTVAMGQTKDEVIANFGQPQRIAKGAGTKEMYFYKDFKVTFVAGKVTDIQ